MPEDNPQEPLKVEHPMQPCLLVRKPHISGLNFSPMKNPSPSSIRVIVVGVGRLPSVVPHFLLIRLFLGPIVQDRTN